MEQESRPSTPGVEVVAVKRGTKRRAIEEPVVLEDGNNGTAMEQESCENLPNGGYSINDEPGIFKPLEGCRLYSHFFNNYGSFGPDPTVDLEPEVEDPMKVCCRATRVSTKMLEYWSKPIVVHKRTRTREYAVENIVSFSVGLKPAEKVYYEVKWQDYPSSANTHERINNLLASLTYLRRFYEREFGKRRNKSQITKIKADLERDIPTALIEDSDRVNDLLTQLNCSFNDLRHRNMKPFEHRLNRDIDDIAYCISCMNMPTAPNDKELRKYGVLLMTMRAVVYRRNRQLKSLRETEDNINRIENCRVYIENNIDFAKFPDDFTYISTNIVSDDVSNYESEAIHCDCEICGPQTNCCAKLIDAENIFMYRSNGRLRTMENVPIYECNSKCKCSIDCNNRVVQRGRKIELIIFKTTTCGWGVKAKNKIVKGTFICEYVGELLSSDDVERRDVDYPQTKDYIFALDFSGADMYSIDATKYGNVARFINHGCDPNLVVCSVWVEDNQNPHVHRLGLFSLKTIEAGEELCFDYIGGKYDPESTRFLERTPCFCGAPNCRRWLFNKRE